MSKTLPENDQVNKSDQHVHGPNCNHDGICAQIYDRFMELCWDGAKYFFYLLVIILYPCSFNQFFFRHGVYPWNSFSCLVKMSISAFCAVMAFWSHWLASPPNDPGFLEKEHFQGIVTKAEDGDPENTGKTENCQKCGMAKVTGVHHCS